MKPPRSLSFIATICILLYPLSVLSDEYKSGVSASVLKRSVVTGSGQRIIYPVTDNAEVTVMLVELPAGAETGWHSHPIPVYAYVLAGTIDVELEGGKVIVYRAGDAIIEAVNTLHNGRNRGSDLVRLVVFYTGIEGAPNVVKILQSHALEGKLPPESSEPRR